MARAKRKSIAHLAEMRRIAAAFVSAKRWKTREKPQASLKDAPGDPG